MNKAFVEAYRRCNQSKYGNDFMSFLRFIYSRDPFCRKLKIHNKGSIRFSSKAIEGSNNEMVVGKNSLVNRVELKVHGSGNKIIIGENCLIDKQCRLYVFGNHTELIIGDNSTVSHDTELLVQENGRKIIIGKDCMFSHHINIRTSDAHPIFALDGGDRINQGKDVYIGNHVWLTPGVIIQKGVVIGDGAIVATNSIVTKDVPSHSVVAGMPARVVKEGVDWGRKIEE